MALAELDGVLALLPLVGHSPPVGCANKMKQANWNSDFLMYIVVGCMCACVRQRQRDRHGNREGHRDTEIQIQRDGVEIRSVQFSCSIMSDSLRPHGVQHAWPPCLSPTPGVYSNSCPSSRWCHPTISSSVIPFSSRLQSFPASESFLMSQFFALGGQSIGASASVSVLLMNIQHWFPLGGTGWISLQFKGLSRVFSNTSVQRHQFFGAQLSL